MSGLKRSRSIKFPTLRFRAKIMLGFAVTLALSAATHGVCLFRLRAGLRPASSAYRQSVAEADLARNIDRELISYRFAGRAISWRPARRRTPRRRSPPKPA